MNVVLWIVTIVLALAFLAAGLMKLTRSKAQLVASGQGWVEGFGSGAVKAIGVAEVLGALGLVLPALTGTALALVPLAAIGLALLMVGALVTHLRRGEKPQMVANAVLFALALLVAWGRLGPYPL